MGFWYDTKSKSKQTTEWKGSLENEELFEVISDKGLRSKVYKELRQLKKKEEGTKNESQKHEKSDHTTAKSANYWKDKG